MRKITEEELTPQPEKRGRGRPKGSKDKIKRKTPKRGPMTEQSEAFKARSLAVDPKTGYVVRIDGQNARIMGKMGDEKVSAFVQYHIDCLKMREGVNKKDPEDMRQRFYRYLAYCEQHCIVPNNMNCYLAIGVTRTEMSDWRNGNRGTPEHQQFAQDVTSFFASIHEQGAIDGVMNPISSIFWQKAHDGMIEASKVEVVNQEPLGDKRSAEAITAQYSDLPD